MDTTTITHLSLCSGYGGIDLGLRRAIGSSLRTVAYAEIEAFACELLLARMEGRQIDPAPIWPDLKSFPWSEFSGRVDILSGGYPCQPFSAAGKRLGTEDPRHLWPFIADGIRILRPRLCFFENVEGHISLGLRDVIEELGRLGYSATWGIFSASEVGAPHQRKRVFILAYRECEGLEGFNNWNAPAESSKNVGADTWASGECGAWLMGNPSSEGYARKAWSGSKCEEGQSLGHSAEPDGGIWPSRPGEPQHAWEPPRVVGNASMLDGPGQAGGQREAQTGRTDTARNVRQTKPSLGRDADGFAGGLDYAQLCASCDNRTDELRLLGNGVVPATAAVAFRTLLQQLLTN